MRLGYTLVTLVAAIILGASVTFGVEHLSGGGAGGYEVRAVFDNSSFVIAGEQVKVAGAIVGTIRTIELTPQNKAAVVLQITDRRFVPFHTDAHCEIDIESLLGEQYVQCTPTQTRAPGSPPAAALPAIASGPNRGQHLLPVQDTTSPVGFDLVQNIQRLPQQERLRLIIAGLGAGLAGNGQELNAALLRADPALQATDQVISVLAREDRTLARLTDESATILAPLAAQRAHLGGFIQHAGAVAAASAQQGRAIEQNLKDLPPFLHQLAPASNRLAALAEQMTPALQSLLAQAPAINASVSNLGPFADSSIPTLKTLGSLAQRGETVFPRTHTLAKQLVALGKPLQPLATDLAGTARSFDNAGGIEDVMRFIYYYAGSVNGEDALGHYIRSLVEISNCSPRTSTPVSGCSATFGTPSGSAAADIARAAVRNQSGLTGTARTATTLLKYLVGQ